MIDIEKDPRNANWLRKPPTKPTHVHEDMDPSHDGRTHTHAPGQPVTHSKLTAQERRVLLAILAEMDDEPESTL